jgi:hypothetical protein
MGEVEKLCPLVGDVMVAAVLGGVSGIVPVKPTEPDSGPGLWANADIEKPTKTTPTTSISKANGRYEVCS